MKSALILTVFAMLTGFLHAEETPTFPQIRQGRAYVCRGVAPAFNVETQERFQQGYIMSYSLSRNKVTVDMTFAGQINEQSSTVCLNADCSQSETVNGNFRWVGSIQIRSGRLRNLNAEERRQLTQLIDTVKTGLEKRPVGDELRLYLWDTRLLTEANLNATRVQQALLYDSVNGQTEEDSHERLILFRAADGRILLTAYLDSFKLIPSACQ